MLSDALRFVRFSHTVFAMPFALGAMLVAARGLPAAKIVCLIVLAMVFARTAAMAFNRLADWDLDQRNPRTAGRHKLISKGAAVGLLCFSIVAFVGTTWLINFPCFVLSPVALGVAFFYSFTKRFTHFSQIFLGLALSVAPMGAWLAVTGRWSWVPCALAGAVMVWVAGFDLIYATQDHDFDRREGLYSGVVLLGVAGALRFAKVLHLFALVLLAVFGAFAGLGMAYWMALVLVGLLLGYEHRCARGLDVQGINRAFFFSNAAVGVIFVAGVALDVLLA